VSDPEAQAGQWHGKDQLLMPRSVGAHSRGLHWTTSSPVKVAILDSGIEIRTEEPTKRSVLYGSPLSLILFHRD